MINNNNLIKRNCRRWNIIDGQIICTTWRFSLLDKVGPYVSLPHIPSPNGVIHQHPNQAYATIEQTQELECGPPQFAGGFNLPQPHDSDHNNRNIRNIPLIHEERNLLGSSYYKLELNFLFSGQTKLV